MQKAQVTKVGDKLIICSQYNERFTSEIRGIPGRVWCPGITAWSVPLGSEQQVRDLVDDFYTYETVRVKVMCKLTTQSRQAGCVSVDGKDLFNPTSGYLDMRPNGAFEILDYSGGKQDGHIDYTLRLKILKNAEWQASGYSEYRASYEILSGNNPIDDFLDTLLSKEQGK